MSLSDFSRHRVEDIRLALAKSGLTEPEIAELKGKTAVVQKAVELGIKAIDIEVKDSVGSNPYKNITFDTIPEYASPSWNDYVLSLLSDDEFSEGYPTLNGLRRVFIKLFGVPLESGPTLVVPSTSETHPGRATVVYEIVFVLPNTEQPRRVREVADSYIGNTDAKYAVYTPAVASSRAEARAVRKCLALSVICADEVTNDTVSKEIAAESIKSISKQIGDTDLSDMELVTSTQLMAMKALCGRLNIDFTKFINAGNNKYDSEVDILKATATKMIKKLNDYQQNQSEIPPALKLN